MRKERMKILHMVEEKIISVEEAERLLQALQNKEESGAKEKVEETMEKTGEVLEDFMKTAKEKADTAIKTVGAKTEEAVKNVEPAFRKAVDVVTDKTAHAAEKMKRYTDAWRGKNKEQESKAEEETNSEPIDVHGVEKKETEFHWEFGVETSEKDKNK